MVALCICEMLLTWGLGTGDSVCVSSLQPLHSHQGLGPQVSLSRPPDPSDWPSTSRPAAGLPLKAAPLSLPSPCSLLILELESEWMGEGAELLCSVPAADRAQQMAVPARQPLNLGVLLK